jgi:hypothetical protein
LLFAWLGEISYLTLTLESDDGTRWLFAPYWIVDEAKLAADEFGKRTWMSGPFHGVVVPGKQTVAYSYMFIGESGLEHFQAPPLTAHKFFEKRRLMRFLAGFRHRDSKPAWCYDARLAAAVSVHQAEEPVEALRKRGVETFTLPAPEPSKGSLWRVAPGGGEKGPVLRLI